MFCLACYRWVTELDMIVSERRLVPAVGHLYIHWTLDTGAAPQAGQLYSQQQWTEWTLSSTVVTLSQIRPLSPVSDNIGQRISATQTISCDTVCSEEDGLHSYID